MVKVKSSLAAVLVVCCASAGCGISAGGEPAASGTSSSRAGTPAPTLADVTPLRDIRDWDGEVADIRLATDGDGCPSCENGKLKTYRGIEGGHIFILGTKYSQTMGATYSDDKMEKQPIVMGCYGIGVSRLVATTIEQHNDADGIRWPMSIAPYKVHLVTIGQDEPVTAWRIIAPNPSTVPIRVSVEIMGSRTPASSRNRDCATFG